MVINLTELKEIMHKHIIEPLDHKHLDKDLKYFETHPRSELMMYLFIFWFFIFHYFLFYLFLFLFLLPAFLSIYLSDSSFFNLVQLKILLFTSGTRLFHFYGMGYYMKLKLMKQTEMQLSIVESRVVPNYSIPYFILLFL